MTIHRISAKADQLAEAILRYANAARALKNGTGDMSMSGLRAIQTNATHSQRLAKELAAEMPKNLQAAQAKLADIGAGGVTEFNAHMVAIQTAAKNFNRAVNAILLDPAVAVYMAVVFRPIPQQIGDPVGTLKGADFLPVTMPDGTQGPAPKIRALPELTALIAALEAAGAK